MNGEVSVRPYSCGDVPSELLLDPLDGRRRRRRARGSDAHPRGTSRRELFGGVGDADEHGRRGAQHGHALAPAMLEHRGHVHLAEADMLRRRPR